MAEEKKNINNNMETKEMSFEERQYERLIDARNFHYENFNKWSLYFYAIIAALFVGYYGVLTAEHKPINVEAILLGILILGYIVSICCFLSGKGYYYWEISWIKLVHRYEKEILEQTKEDDLLRAYSVFFDKEKSSHPLLIWEGANISSSKLSLWMSFLITCSWGYLLLCNIPVIYNFLVQYSEFAVVGASVVATFVVTALLCYLPCVQSDMNPLDEARKEANL